MVVSSSFGVGLVNYMVSGLVGYLSRYSDVVRPKLVSIGCWI